MDMLRRDSSGFIHDAFIKERVINPLVKEYRNSDVAKGHDLQTRRKFENYIHDIAGRVHKEDLSNDMAEVVHVMRNKKYGFHGTPMEELALDYAKKVGKITDPKHGHYKEFKSTRGSTIVSNAMDEFFKNTAAPSNKSKVKGLKIDITTLKNSIVKANQQRVEYTSYIEEEAQMKKLGINE
jgi:hypothetical protein